jgi:DNA-binding SARP family transcriptional activator
MNPGSISTAERGGAEIPLRPTGAGLGLIGPGAAGAARAIAASVLSAGAPDRTGDLARLIIPAADLGILLGLNTGDLPAIAAAVPELFITDDLAAALAEAEVNALLRTRLLEEAEADDLDQLEREHPDVEECPPLVVMASPQRAETGRIGALIDQSAHLRITTVTLGAHPRAATVYVGADGHTEGPDLAEWTGARMFNLPAAAFTDVLHLLAAAAGHLPTPEPEPRPDLTLVHDGEPQPAGEAEPPDTDAARDPDTADPDEAAAQPSVQASGADRPAAPRLVLVDDPAEDRAQQALTAWDERPVRISVLGPLLIEADGEQVAKLRSQARPIAALLAWKGPSGASDQQIDATCWPDEDDPARIQQWRQDGLKSLRGRLRLTTGRKTAPFIARDHRGYLLEPAFTTADLWVLQALEAAASATRDPQAKARYLTRAAEFCTGTLLAEETGPDFAWADGPRVTITGLQVSVLARLAELAADDEPDKALAALRRAAAMAEDNEHLHLRIIDLLAALGRHAEIPAQMQILTAHADSMGASVSQAARAHAARALRTADARP